MRMSAEFLPIDARGGFDEFEGRLMQTALEVLVPVEVAVSLFDDDVTLEQ